MRRAAPAAPHQEALPRWQRLATRTALVVPLSWLCVAALLLSAEPALTGALTLVDSDDLMRLVQVRDLLAGQGWFDLVQYRLNPPEGVAMHWSRFVDLPLAAGIGLLRPLLGVAAAERWIVALWPVLLLLPALWLLGGLVRRLMGPTALPLGVLLALSGLIVFSSFWPGRIDHHGPQIVLMLAGLVLLVRCRERPHAALLAGAAAGLSVTIGAEGVPFAAAGGAALAIAWIAGLEDAPRLLTRFLAALAGVLALALPATVALAQLWVPQCDAASVVHLSAAAGACLLSLALPPLGRVLRGPFGRGLGVAGLALALAAGLLLTFPTCLSGPFQAVDPQMRLLWLDNVREARSLFAFLQEHPERALAISAFPLTALPLTIAAFRRAGEARWAWGVVLAFLAVAIALMAWMIRGAPFANALAVPGAAWLLQRLAEDSRLRRGPRAALLAVSLTIGNGVVPTVAAAALAQAGALPDRTEGARAEACLRAVPALDRLPPGRVLAVVDLGPMTLAHTRHAVFAAPYHRNVGGNLLALRAFTSRPAASREALAAAGVDWIVLCPGLPETGIYRQRNPEGLLAALLRGEAPGWLRPLPVRGQGPLRIWQMMR